MSTVEFDDRRKSNAQQVHELALDVHRDDTAITDIVVQAQFVSVYTFDEVGKEWARNQVEGSLYIIRRAGCYESQYWLLVINQRVAHHLSEKVTPHWKIASEPNFFFYRVPLDPHANPRPQRPEDRKVYAIWFHEDSERISVVQTLSTLLTGFAMQRRLNANVQKSTFSMSDNLQKKDILSHSKTKTDDNSEHDFGHITNLPHRKLRSSTIPPNSVERNGLPSHFVCNSNGAMLAVGVRSELESVESPIPVGTNNICSRKPPEGRFQFDEPRTEISSVKGHHDCYYYSHVDHPFCPQTDDVEHFNEEAMRGTHWRQKEIQRGRSDYPNNLHPEGHALKPNSNERPQHGTHWTTHTILSPADAERSAAICYKDRHCERDRNAEAQMLPEANVRNMALKRIPSEESTDHPFIRLTGCRGPTRVETVDGGAALDRATDQHGPQSVAQHFSSPAYAFILKVCEDCLNNTAEDIHNKVNSIGPHHRISDRQMFPPSNVGGIKNDIETDNTFSSTEPIPKQSPPSVVAAIRTPMASVINCHLPPNYSNISTRDGEDGGMPLRGFKEDLPTMTTLTNSEPSTMTSVDESLKEKTTGNSIAGVPHFVPKNKHSSGVVRTAEIDERRLHWRMGIVCNCRLVIDGGGFGKLCSLPCTNNDLCLLSLNKESCSTKHDSAKPCYGRGCVCECSANEASERFDLDAKHLPRTIHSLHHTSMHHQRERTDHGVAQQSPQDSSVAAKIKSLQRKHQGTQNEHHATPHLAVYTNKKDPNVSGCYSNPLRARLSITNPAKLFPPEKQIVVSYRALLRATKKFICSNELSTLLWLLIIDAAAEDQQTS